MVEINQIDVDKMINKLYRDALIRKSAQTFLTLTYTPENFPKNMQIVLSPNRPGSLYVHPSN